MRIALSSLGAAALVLAGCGAAGSTPSRRALDLDAVVPDGAETVVRLRPRTLLANDATARVVTAIVPDERLDAFAARHGVALREAELLIHVSFGGAGSVLLASGPFHAEVVVGEIGHRMAPLESSADQPVYRRAGIYQRRRFELLALGPHEVAMVEGSPALSGLVLHTRDVPPVSEDRVRALVASERDAPFLFVRHGRPELPPEGVGLLFARLEDIALAVGPVGEADPGALELRARLFGEFPPGVDDNLRTLIASLSEDDLGRAVGLEEIAQTLAIDVLDREIRLTAHVRASTLARGLRVLLGAELDEMLDEI